MYVRKQPKQEKDYKIALQSKQGNVVGWINLSSQFCKAVFKTVDPTLTDIQALADGNPIDFLKSLEIAIEPVLPDEPIKAEDY